MEQFPNETPQLTSALAAILRNPDQTLLTEQRATNLATSAVESEYSNPAMYIAAAVTGLFLLNMMPATGSSRSTNSKENAPTTSSDRSGPQVTTHSDGSITWREGQGNHTSIHRVDTNGIWTSDKDPRSR
jgi:hypothetical protein